MGSGKKGKKFRKFRWKALVSESCFKKVAGIAPANLLKKRYGHRCFPVNSAKYLRAPFLYNTSEQLIVEKKSTSLRYSKKYVRLSTTGNSVNEKSLAVVFDVYIQRFG